MFFYVVSDPPLRGFPLRRYFHLWDEVGVIPCERPSGSVCEGDWFFAPDLTAMLNGIALMSHEFEIPLSLTRVEPLRLCDGDEVAITLRAYLRESAFSFADSARAFLGRGRDE